MVGRGGKEGSETCCRGIDERFNDGSENDDDDDCDDDSNEPMLVVGGNDDSGTWDRLDGMGNVGSERGVAEEGIWAVSAGADDRGKRVVEAITLAWPAPCGCSDD
jgi:hypothetical protein